MRYAVADIAYMLRTQHNAWRHAIGSACVVAAGLAFRVTAADWRWLVAAMAIVWVAEAMNTAFEHLCDVVSPEFHDGVQKSKDVAAGAVLLAAIAAPACRPWRSLNATGLYADLPGDPRGAMIVRMIDLEASGVGARPVT